MGSEMCIRDRTKGVGQKIMAAAASVPVSVMETAGEGGAWGIAVLASYMKMKEEGETLEHFLDQKVFAGQEAVTVSPDPEDAKGFDAFIGRYKLGLAAERGAVDALEM